ncbi:MAG TPA: MATE family efflux transporter [Candidatus Gallacutalibacter stercoravium]|nr:MATE family efflux transporter [Candidatus Gallacutalibacter stercoravium]
MTKTLTSGNPAKLILLFTLPLLVGNLFQQMYNMADTLIVGRTLGVNALAAVGCTGSISFLIIGFAQGLTAGLSIVTAQNFGAGNHTGVRRSFAASVLISLGVTVVLTAIGVIFARPFLQLLNTPAAIIDDAYSYIVVIYGGIFASVLFNLLSNIIRALGDSRTPLYFLVIACLVNIGLDYFFILVLHSGVAGAAWATVISQLLSGVLCLVYIKYRFPILHLTRDDWKLTGVEIAQHLRVGLPMAFQSSIISIGSIILQTALNGLGATSVAAYTASQKIDTLATMPMMSFGMTMATYAAQNFGAGRIARIRKGIKQCCLMSVSFSIVMGIVNITCGRYLVGLFVGDEPQVIELSKIFLTINGCCYFILALLFIFRYTLQGLGQSFVPTFAGIMELCMRTLASLVFAQYFGFAGACMANPLAWLGSCVPLCIAYAITMRKMRRSLPPDPPEEEAA